MHHAAECDRLDLAELFISRKAEVNAKSTLFETPLHLAAEKGNLKIVELLISRGAEIDPKDHNGMTPIHRTSLRRKEMWARSTRHEGYDWTGSRSDNLGVFELLVQKKADILAITNSGETLIHLAAKGVFTLAIEFLLSRGLDINARDTRGNTPLHSISLETEHERAIADSGIVAFLIEQGADLHARNLEGKTPMDISKEHGNRKIADAFSYTIKMRDPVFIFELEKLGAALDKSDRREGSL
ncbi:MAG: ankyrin repeat domain-containing protein [Candidatus Xenobiia bacterium LiM19]